MSCASKLLHVVRPVSDHCPSVVPYIPTLQLYKQLLVLQLTPLTGDSNRRSLVTFIRLLVVATVSGSGISWAICKSAPCSRQITMPAPHLSVFFVSWMPFLPPNQQCQSTEGIKAFMAYTEFTFLSLNIECDFKSCAVKWLLFLFWCINYCDNRIRWWLNVQRVLLF